MSLKHVPSEALVKELVSRYKCVLVVVNNEGHETMDDDYEMCWYVHTEDDSLGAVGLCRYAEVAIMNNFFGFIGEDEEEEDAS